METLQSVVLPNLDVPGDEALYVRTNDRAFCELAPPRLRFVENGEATTDTYYGGLTVGAWKRTSPVRTLFLELDGEGEFVVSVGVHRLGQARLWLCEHEVELAAGEPRTLPVDGWGRVDDGMLFVRLRARRTGTVRSARYVTADAPRNDVRLGLVVTHFNRQAQVLPAIERIRRQVLRHPEVRGRITLTVVDNSRNLAVDDGAGVTRIPNRNLGGSGGFARGLLSLVDDGGTTHCLFMDDDASCEADGLLRTFALLRYAASPRVAVAGALLSEAEPWHMLEKGARFDGKCRPLMAGADMRRVDELLWAERKRDRVDYGGWWFFAFPIAAVEQYPFPFFIRGDDVFFSLNNRFEIVTLNGVACLAEEFRVKHGPLTSYLDSRYHLLHLALRERGRAKMLKRLVSNQFLKPLMAYHYSSARGFTLALRHVARGPAFFRENLDMAAVRAEIGAWQPSEKLQPIDRSGLKLRPARPPRESLARKVFRALTLQGFLLPGVLLRERVPVHDKSFYGRASSVFRYRRVLYEHVPSDTGYLAEYDRPRFFAELGAMLAALAAFARRLPELHREYAEAVPQLASERFWREVYGLAPAARDPASPNDGRGLPSAGVPLPSPEAAGGERAVAMQPAPHQGSSVPS